MRPLSEWLEEARYGHPGKVATVFVGMLIIALTTIFLRLPDTTLLNAMGITDLQRRLSATANAVYWSFRASINVAHEPLTSPQRLFGTIDGLRPSGDLVVTVAEGSKWIHKSFSLADTIIIDVAGVAAFLAKLRFANARIDVYNGNQAVVWVSGAPINVKLIEAGLAKPDPWPPTNIVDVAFATYYWNIAKGTAASPSTIMGDTK